MQKTKKSVAKRFKLAATGKLMRRTRSPHRATSADGAAELTSGGRRAAP